MIKAMRLKHPASLETLYLGATEAPAPGRGEIKVRVRANSLNFRDYLIATGYLPSAPDVVPLSDAAGDVLEVGDGVSEFKPGDRVVSTFHPAWLDGHIDRLQLAPPPGGMADGFACEQVTRPATSFTHAPSHFTYAESATLTCAGVTAWRALIDGPVKPGDTVLVQGTGGVSLFALQFAKIAGATVIATSSSNEKLARLKELGADHVLDYRADPKWGEAALALTGGVGVDHVIEIGGPKTLPQSLLAARQGGHIALIGAVGGFDGAIPFAIVQAKRLRIQGVTVGSRRDQIDLVRALEAHRAKPVIAATFPLAELPAALRRHHEGAVGKICLEN